MLGFDPVTISSLLILAGSSNKLCNMPKPTSIKVIPATEKVQMITDKTLAEMQSVQTDTINPYGFDAASFTQGYAEGRISFSYEVKYGNSVIPRKRAACIWYDEIVVRFQIDPKVYIAKEVYDDRCMRKAVVGHEMKHVMTDRKVVNKYSKIIGKKLYSELRARGFMAGPVRADTAQSVADRMSLTIQQILDLEQRRMELDRHDMQLAVDSLDEYERVGDMCPDWNVTEEMLNPSSAKSSSRSRR